MMMTLYMQKLPDDWIRPTAWPVQRGGIVTSSRFCLRFLSGSQIGGPVFLSLR